MAYRGIFDFMNMYGTAIVPGVEIIVGIRVYTVIDRDNLLMAMFDKPEQFRVKDVIKKDTKWDIIIKKK
ncbi:MAG: hypothetical protein Q8Q42_01290 [Nanoarchaeota archaeon]|nr:hypothetical protein [Nanoarchaeota archaeon]